MNQQDIIKNIFSGSPEDFAINQRYIRSEFELREICDQIFDITDDKQSSFTMSALLSANDEVSISCHSGNFESAESVLTAIADAQYKSAKRVCFDYRNPTKSIGGSITLEFVARGVLVSSYRVEY